MRTTPLWIMIWKPQVMDAGGHVLPLQDSQFSGGNWVKEQDVD